MKRLIIIFSIGVLAQSCIQDDRFGLSSRKDILSYEVVGQAGSTTIDTDSLKVIVPVDLAFDRTSAAPFNISLSNMASVEPGVGDSLDFTTGQIYVVTAEDGSQASWNVEFKRQGPEVQLPNSDFNQWYDAGGYPEPGDGSGSSVWGTANKGLSLVGGYNTEPVSDGNNGFYAKMTSQQAPALVRMAAATLFTGKFTDGFPSVSDPRSNIDFGTPFTAQPTGFRVRYKYQPGASYEDANGNSLPEADECDIYVLLEQWVTNGNETIKRRVGTAWHRSSDAITDWTELALDINYGESSGTPEYAQPKDGYAEPGTAPTHITVVFSSSAQGDFFIGAIGSVLEVDDFALIY